ncbi:hypothetical protein NEUTE1DRAFT_101650 [Neurospora tetrasperma FGSC 2508]|uniref:Uncharacterized protein n=1 Tax=Neurospora tetrasperma (strain FGSC 2508 / ATCC MYA-4615 / P0657) TaxID=510951 RepID=F8MPU2_NEUT8|nr:uncharacterized protein NEUTE1DRAFT_101650 [Neurospora tetrasperma FGSC 2508]EGO56372.1 hypothetical protein NEUTE1DRAFT_101650 [Neurospora tetrasperma FGSC 2508]
MQSACRSPMRTIQHSLRQINDLTRGKVWQATKGQQEQAPYLGSYIKLRHMQVRLEGHDCLSLNFWKLGGLLSGVSLERVVKTPASSSPISGKLVPDRVSVVVPSVSAPRTPLRFADDDGRVRAGFQPSEPSYRGSYSQLRHSISSTGLAGSQPFRVSLSQRSQVNYNLDAPSIMFLAVSSVKWDTRVSVRQEDVCQN